MTRAAFLFAFAISCSSSFASADDVAKTCEGVESVVSLGYVELATTGSKEASVYWRGDGWTGDLILTAIERMTADHDMSGEDVLKVFSSACVDASGDYAEMMALIEEGIE